jgi:uncharacterized protein (DUF433 family)
VGATARGINPLVASPDLDSYTEDELHMQDYVDSRDGGFYIAGTRIALDGIIHAFRNGASPESILRSFPWLVR